MRASLQQDGNGVVEESARSRARQRRQRARYMTLETIAPLSDDPAVSFPAIAG
ncbi:hypothetical protein [Bradyrhizobium sp. BR 1432]|uniref:hypothetical protein n=1 Tax=Bradyrhizobium sp. BR 1432 TaxID=3447966 RepID=UPI003EE55ACF